MSAFERLLDVGAGRVLAHASVGSRTTYRVGGRVHALVLVNSLEDLAELGPLMDATDLPLFVLGNGSNVLVNDGEHAVIVLRLGGELSSLRWRRENDAVIVDAGGALELPVAARRLARDAVTGFEWAVGVPGTFGGAVAMNAGGHGSDMAASVTSVRVWRDGAQTQWLAPELSLGYRTSAISSRDVVTSVTLSLAHDTTHEAEQRVRDVVRWRRENQPGGHNAGSVFRNPPHDHAARLIDLAGCKGLHVGGARVSDKHANFIQVENDARAGDVYALIGLVRERVQRECGVALASEHRYVGFEGES